MSGLYNAIFGHNRMAPLCLGLLGLEPEDVGRFRDAYFTEEDCEGEKLEQGLTICVYTRNGGGNREEYQPVIDQLAKHPNYLFDQDDSFDSTYCSIYFAIPEKYKEAMDFALKANSGFKPAKSGQVKFLAMIEDMKKVR